MGKVIKLNGISYITTVDDVIDTMRDLIVDGPDSETTEDKQKVCVDFTIYELDLLVKEIDRLRQISKS